MFDLVMRLPPTEAGFRPADRVDGEVAGGAPLHRVGQVELLQLVAWAPVAPAAFSTPSA